MTKISAPYARANILSKALVQTICLNQRLAADFRRLNTVFSKNIIYPQRSQTLYKSLQVLSLEGLQSTLVWP